MADIFDPYYEWLGIPPAEQPPNHYRLLGIGLFEENAGVIANAADRQMGHLRGFAAGKHSQSSQKLLNEVAAARVCLLNPEKKVDYDGQLRQQVALSTAPIPRAMPVASSVVMAEAPPPPLPVVHEEGETHLLPERSGLPPLIMMVGAAVGFVLLGAVVWWLSGLGKAQQAGPEPRLAGAERDERGGEGKPEQPHVPAGGDGAGSKSDLIPPRDPQNPEPADPLPPTQSAEPDPTRPPMFDPPERSSEEPEPPALPGPEDAPMEPPVDPGPVDPGPVDPGPVDPGPADVPEEPSPSEPVQVAKKPVPDAATQQEVRRVLDETYDTNAARSIAERIALVDQLAALVEKSDDTTERFVLLRRASELASEAGAGERMMQLVGRIADEFDVDRLRVQVAMLDGFSKKATTEEQIGAMVRSSAAVIDEALATGRFDLADSLSAAVYRTCQAAAGRAFRVEALNRRRKVQEQRGQWDAMQAARTTLQSNPDDEAANTAMGRWLCFVLEDWEQGPVHLAKGSEPELKALAARELNGSTLDVSAQVELADAWWDLAATVDPRAKMALFRRAVYWYQRAQPELTSTLVKAKVAKRLEEFAKIAQAEPQQPATGPSPAVAPFDAQRAAQIQQTWAKHLNVPVEEVNPIGMRLRLIPPGEFMMGSNDGAGQMSPRYIVGPGGRLIRPQHPPEGPVHRVRITQPFWIGITEVTQEQFFRVMGANPSRTMAPALPVDRVAWSEAMEFCRRLTQTLGKKLGGRVYRLPTEAEWEYACRAGSDTRYYFGDNDATLAEFAWFMHNSNGRLQPVGGTKPNPWGLYDMYGNATEWVLDWASYDYYSTSPVDDPVGPPTGVTRVGRGGSCESSPSDCRSAARNLEMPQYRRSYTGFRVVIGSADILTKMVTPNAETPATPDAETGRPGEEMTPRPTVPGNGTPGSGEGASGRSSGSEPGSMQPGEGTFDHMQRTPSMPVTNQ